MLICAREDISRGDLLDGARVGVEYRRAHGEPDLQLVDAVRPTRSRVGRCGRCGRRGPGYDQGQGRCRWRGLDLGTMRVYLEADAPRVACAEHGVTVACAEHGVTVAAVPWGSARRPTETAVGPKMASDAGVRDERWVMLIK